MSGPLVSLEINVSVSRYCFAVNKLLLTDHFLVVVLGVLVAAA
jgi:hypothetical protein